MDSQPKPNRRDLLKAAIALPLGFASSPAKPDAPAEGLSEGQIRVYAGG